MSLQTFLEKMNGISFIVLMANYEWGAECIYSYDIEDIDEISEDLLERTVDRAEFQIFDSYDNSTYITANIYLTY